VFFRLKELPGKFAESMDDDFNTAKAIGHIFDCIRLINGYMSKEGFVPTAEALFVLDTAKNRIREIGKVLGLFLDDPDEYFRKDKEREAARLGLDVDEINGLIEKRTNARAEKDWAEADRIRDVLAEKGVVIQDSPASTTWKIKNILEPKTS
jgi:cysteinyl-tRNA synthetase